MLAHTCVGSLAGTDGYFRSGKTSSNSHFGTGGDGTIYQWVDTAVRSTANGAGNHRSITIENADMGAEFAPWNTRDGNAVPAFTAAQIEANARIAEWAHRTHGVPLVAADTSRPSARGVGFHRLGCNPWRVPDGELWSSANGKVCPGPRRIAQIPQIIARAAAIKAGAPPQEDDMPLTPDEIERIAIRTRDHLATGANPWGLDALLGRIINLQVTASGLSAAVTKLADSVASDRDDLTADELQRAVALGIQEAGESLRAVQSENVHPDA